VEADVPSDVVEAMASVHMACQRLPTGSESTGHAQLIARAEHGRLSVASDGRADGAGRVVC